MKQEEIVAAVYDAAQKYVYSVVPPKMVDDLDISVSFDSDTKEVSVDIRLVTGRGDEIDQRTVNEAIEAASAKADELMKGF
jgi:hypothetical protein